MSRPKADKHPLASTHAKSSLAGRPAFMLGCRFDLTCCNMRALVHFLWDVVGAMNCGAARTFASIVLASGLVMSSAVLGHAKSAPPRQKAWSAEGAGITSCTDFEKVYKAAPDQTTDFFSWTEGYLTGMDQRAKADGRPPINLGIWNDEKQAQFLNSYCASHPSRLYGDAATEL